MTIEIESETAQKLLFLAKTKGVSVEELLRFYIPGLNPEVPLQTPSPAERAKAVHEWAESHRRDIPPLSDEAVSRKSFYE